MNIVQLQEQLKNFSQDQLVREMQMPSGTAPQFLVLGEIMRRQKMQQDFAAQQAKGAPQSTVAEDAIAASGVPQQGLASMARSLAPQTDMAGSTGVQAMATGGPVKKMQRGGAAMTDPAIRAMANRMGMSVEEYLRSVGEEQAARLEASAARRALRERMVGMEPQQESFLQRVNPSYEEDLTGRFPVSGYSEPGPDFLGFGTYDGGAPPSRPGVATGDMTSIADAVAAGQRRGGRGGIVDAMLASGESGRLFPAALAAPDVFDVRRAMAAQEEPYFPGAAAASELNLPAFRNVAGGAGIAGALRAAAEGYTPPVAPGAGRAGFATGTPRGVRAPEGFVPLDVQAERIAQGEAAMEGRAGVMTAMPEERGFDPFRDRGRTITPLEGPNGFQQAWEFLTTPVNPEVSMMPELPSERAPSRAEKDDVIDMEAEAKRSAEEAAAARDAAGITRSLEAPFTLPQEQPTQPTTGATASGGMSSYEQELMNMLQRREKAAEQDKWLALAQVGLNMMSSTQPTLLGAIGEAGVKGVEAARTARDQYDKDRLDLLGALEQSRQARAAAAARAAAGASSARRLPEGILDVYDAEIEAIGEALGNTLNPPTPDDQLRLVNRRDALLAEKAALRDAFLSQYGVQRTGASPAGASGVYSMDDVTQ